MSWKCATLVFALAAACNDAPRNTANDAPNRAGTSLETPRPTLPSLDGPWSPLSPKSLAPTSPNVWNTYWRTGLAELSRFSLRQARYGELRDDGEAIVVFVTEDFLPGKQVKSERPRPPSAVLPVLKMNALKRFVTGIYDYSMMLSVFAPIAWSSPKNAIKAAASAQEWCGQVYAQLNRQDDGRWRLREHSYFEGEGDEERSIDGALLEDELWLRARLSPRDLPVGEIRVVPGLLSGRLRHARTEPHRALAELRASASADRVLSYRLRYPEGQRTLEVYFRAAFPHDVLGFDETYADGFGTNRPVLTSRARRTHLLRDRYWTHNRSHDRSLRKKLGLR